MAALTIGPFDLHAPIGRGGMGEVWKGVHRATETLVAIKLLTGRGSVRPYFLSAFRNEVRAMAGLEHPYIAMVLDHGEVTPAEADRSEGTLQAGYPYIAMELAEGGSLAPWCGRLSWNDVHDIVTCLLDALAHAHARGVIHRDLKPGNVLLGLARGPRPGVKLSDFGLAHLQRDAFDGDPLAGGTPHYMAPEQRSRARVEQGPATDLYGLGRLVAALLWGSPTPQPAQLASGPPVPPEVHPWLARLLAADPADRFESAADAHAAMAPLTEVWASRPVLSQLHLLGVSSDTFALTRPPTEREPTDDSSRPRLEAQTALDGDDEDAPLNLVGSASWQNATDGAPPVHGERALGGALDHLWSQLSPTPALPAPVAPTWRRQAPPAPPPRLMDAGLSLYGLRPPPFTGRERERDRLWKNLLEAHEERRPRVVVVRGSAGCGLSRLGEWLCERSHELGAAHSVRVTSDPQGGPSDGLGPALARALRCAGLPRPLVIERLTRLVERLDISDPDEALALAELVQPASRYDAAAGARLIQFSGPLERHAVLRRLLTALAARRPQVLWIDDAQWADDGLAFVEWLMQGPPAGPMLAVLTVTDEELVRRPAEAAALARLIALPQTDVIEVHPLEPEHRIPFLQGLLGLDGALAAEVEARAAGNPTFAVQLIGDWVFRGVLQPGPRGYRVRPGASVELPQHLYEVWAAHLDAILSSRPPEHRHALEIAATLGLDVDGREWALASAEAGLEAPGELIETLLTRRLARTRGDPAHTWSFAHAMLREAVSHGASLAGRSEAQHAACAAMLHRELGASLDELRASRLTTGEARQIERLGRHSLQAGRHPEAATALTLAARSRVATGDYGVADGLLVDLKRALDGLSLPPGAEQRLEAALLEGRIARFRGQVDVASSLLSEVVQTAETRGVRRLQAEALADLGALTWGRGAPSDAVALARRSVEVAIQVGDPALTGQSRGLLSAMLRRRGELREAELIGRQATADHRAAGDELGEGNSLLGLGDIARLDMRRDDARIAFEQALRCYERAGAWRGVADCQNALGEVARLEGRLEEAERRYRLSLTRLEAMGAQLAVAPLCNLGLCLVESGRFAEAFHQLQAAQRTFERIGLRIYLGNVSAYQLPCLAALGDWQRFDATLATARQQLDESQQVELDVARMAGLAAELAANAGQTRRARAALELCVGQWRALGRQDLVETLSATMLTLVSAE